MPPTPPNPEPAVPLADRTARLTEVIRLLEEKFGAGIIYRLSQARPNIGSRAVSTGSLGIDHLTGCGGVPRGRLSTFDGPESSGKATLAYHVLANAQKGGGLVAYVDAEGSADYEGMRACGVDFSDLVLAQPADPREAFALVDALAHCAALDAVVLSPLARPAPSWLLAEAGRRITVSAGGTPTAVVLVGTSRPGRPTPLTAFASLSVALRPVKMLIRPGGDIFGLRVLAEIAKNRQGRPGGAVEFEIDDEHGVRREAELLDLGIQVGVVESLADGLVYGRRMLGYGRARALAALERDPGLAAEIEAALRRALNLG